MDPVSAAGLASSIITFVEFSTRIIQGSYEIYSSASGTTLENVHIGTVVEDLEKVTSDMSGRIKGIQDPELSVLCAKCHQLSIDLQQVLNKIKIKLLNDKWSSLVASWKTYRKRKEVVTLENRLEKYSQQMILRLSVILCAEQSSVKAKLEALQNHGLAFSNSTAREMQGIRKDVRSLFDVVLDKQSRMQGLDAIDTFQKLKQFIMRLESIVPTLPKSNTVLERLHFDSIFHREDQIVDPSDETFDWMVDWVSNGRFFYTYYSGAPSSQSQLPQEVHATDHITPSAPSDLIGKAHCIESETSGDDIVEESNIKTLENSNFHPDLAQDQQGTDNNAAEAERPEDPYDDYSDGISISSSSSTWSSTFSMRSAENRQRHESSKVLLEFLQGSNGTYFICGKAGCGKSTMMKYLASNESVHNALKSWARNGQKDIITVPIFFWRSGNPLQMSCEGFYRSVLFHTLRQCPEIIDTLFPPGVVNLQQGRSTDLFRLADLKNAFERLAISSTNSKYRICFFVDGLDEYEGGNTEHRWLGQQLKAWSQLDDVKVMCAARPHTVFLDVFRDSGPTIFLHELNRQDIHHFASRQFRLILKDVDYETARENCLLLVDRIVGKADGVFFWVVMVVRSLLNSALEHDDTLESLEKRLNEFPLDLNSLFGQLLEGVDKSPSARKRSEIVLLGALENSPRRKMTAMLFSYLEDAKWFDNDSRSDYPFSITPSVIPNDEVESRQQRVRWMLHQLTNGLLEMVKDRDGNESQPYWKYQVTFMHRSVRDYLTDYWVVKPEIRERQKQLRENLAFARLCLAEAKFKPCVFTEGEGFSFVVNLPEDLLVYLGKLVRSSPSLAPAFESILSDFDKTIQAQRQARSEAGDNNVVLTSIAFRFPRVSYRSFKTIRTTPTIVDDKPVFAEGSFLHWLLYTGSTEFALKRIGNGVNRGDIDSQNSTSLLLASTMCLVKSKSDSTVECARFLLNHGARPHDELKMHPMYTSSPQPEINKIEVWHVLLLQFATISINSPGQYEYLHLPSRMVELFLEFGADVDPFFLVQRLGEDEVDDSDADSILNTAEPELFRAELADIVKLGQPENMNAILGYLESSGQNERMWWRAAVKLATGWVGGSNIVAEKKKHYKLASFPDLRRGRWALEGFVSHRGVLDYGFKVRIT